MPKKKVTTTKQTWNSSGEPLIYLGKNKDDYIAFMGVGTVCRVEKGERADRVLMHFGVALKSLYVVNNHARRQIYTLKKGQLAMVVGTCKVFQDKGRRAMYFANGFLAWYVPKMLDIKKYDTEDLEKLEEEQDTDLTNYLDELLGEQK